MVLSPRNSDLNALLIKLAPEGSLVWEREWGGRDGDNPAGVSVAPDGTVLLAGQTSSFGAGSDDAFVVRVSPEGRGIDARTWGNAGLDAGAGIAAAPDGTISLGATAELPPPYSFARSSSKTARVRGALGTPSIPVQDAMGAMAEAGGVVSTPDGSTTFGGGFDAALVRIAP